MALRTHQPQRQRAIPKTSAGLVYLWIDMELRIHCIYCVYLSANDIGHNNSYACSLGFSIQSNCLWLLVMCKITVQTLFMAYANVMLEAKYRKVRQKAKFRS